MVFYEEVILIVYSYLNFIINQLIINRVGNVEYMCMIMITIIEQKKGNRVHFVGLQFFTSFSHFWCDSIAAIWCCF